LELINDQRITKTNLIPNLIWYVVFISAILLSIILPFDVNINEKFDSIILIALIWIPIVSVYYIYITELERIVDSINELIEELKKDLKKEGISCPKNINQTL